MSYYENLQLEKGMYNVSGKSFTDVLESLDPSENYEDTPLKGLDAFQRQLKRFDIKVSGKGSDRVEKFFASASSSALFPEYVSRAVKQGMDYDNQLSDIVATVTEIDGYDYRSIESSASDDDKELKVVIEGTLLPETFVSTRENLVKLKKRGRMLVGSYEALRFQRLDLFTITLKQIGAYIARTLTSDAIDVLLKGDGNSNAITTVTKTTEHSYADIIDAWQHILPYQMNTILTSTAAMAKILNFTEMKDASAGLNFHGTGNMITPLGAKLIHVPGIESGNFIALDKNYALEMVQAGGIVTEYDKLIDRQLERASISCIAGFSKIFKEASVYIDY